VKIKIGKSWGTGDRERISRARRSVGDGVDLFVDANGAYGAKQAVRLGRHLDAEHVTWLEEPVSSDDLAGLARVRDAVRADVTAGEYGYTLADRATATHRASRTPATPALAARRLWAP
jgi:L-alanine-DL-glutamate epimerase-like enolase superfamily enzyme